MSRIEWEKKTIFYENDIKIFKKKWLLIIAMLMVLCLGGTAEGEKREKLLPDGEGQDRHLLGGHQEGVGWDEGGGRFLFFVSVSKNNFFSHSVEKKIAMKQWILIKTLCLNFFLGGEFINSCISDSPPPPL